MKCYTIFSSSRLLRCWSWPFETTIGRFSRMIFFSKQQGSWFIVFLNHRHWLSWKEALRVTRMHVHVHYRSKKNTRVINPIKVLLSWSVLIILSRYSSTLYTGICSFSVLLKYRFEFPSNLLLCTRTIFLNYFLNDNTWPSF